MRSKLSSAFAALILHAVALAAVLLTVSGCEKSGDGSLPKPEPTVEENVSLSLGSGTITKTILGEPDGSSYPVYWCEGDRIAVNGKRSEPLHGIGDKVTDATFSVFGVSAPYGVVYPSWICGAMDENVAEITIQTVQRWIPGSFSNGSAVLYGRSDSKDFTLTNLCGVVRIPVDFGKYEIADITLTSLGEPLAGKFDLSLADGKLTAVDAGQSISLSLPEGGFAAGYGDGPDSDAASIEGGSKAVELNFCVPAGVYAEGFNLTITEKYGRKMVIEMRENTAVSSGVIVGWTEQTFVPSGALIITDPESWNTFAAAVNAGDYSQWKNPESGEVSIVANVTSTDDLVQIENWDGVLNGGGYTITRNSISKPLIKSITETGVVKNLKLGGLRTNPGANSSATLAATNLGLVENCENRAGLSVTVDAALHFCGLVEANGGVMRDCTNSADFEINLPFSANHEFMGGGLAFRPDAKGADGTTRLGTFENCRNSGNITILKDATADSDLQKCAVGGILASAYGGTADSFVILKDCVNEGKITLWENKFKNAKVQGAYAIGGIVGRIAKIVKDAKGCQYLDFSHAAFYAEITGCSNTGTIDVCSSISSNVTSGMSGARQCYVGGIAGAVVGLAESPAKIENCSNSGSILAGGTLAASAIVGGIVGGTGYSTFISCTCTGTFGKSANTLATPVEKIGSVAGIASHILNLPPVTMKGCSSTSALPSEASIKGELYATAKDYKPTIE